MLDRDVCSFNEHGYAGPFLLRDLGAVERLRQFVDGRPRAGAWNWAMSKLGVAHDRRIDQIHGHVAFGSVYAGATQAQLLDDVEDLIGPDVLLWKGRIIVRDPGDDGQGWHVDHDNKLLNGVHITVALTDVTMENGGLVLIPKTQKYDVSLQRNLRQGALGRLDSASALALADKTHPENAPHRLVEMTLRKGEYFLTRGGLWHCVMPNTTQASRIILVARYMRPDVRSRHWSHNDEAVRVVREKSLPCILVRGTDRHHLNELHDPPAH